MGIYLITPATVRHNTVTNAAHMPLEANAGRDIEQNSFPAPMVYVDNRAAGRGGN